MYSLCTVYVHAATTMATLKGVLVYTPLYTTGKSVATRHCLPHDMLWHPLPPEARARGRTATGFLNTATIRHERRHPADPTVTHSDVR